MTAYGAVNSLRNTIDYILHSSHFSLVDPSPNIIQVAYEELNPLQEILERLDSTSKSRSRSRKKVNALDERIKELIWEFEDILESLVYQHILSQFPADQVDEDDVGGEKIRFTIDLQFLQHHIPSFIERLEEMEEEYIYEVDNMPEDEDDDEVESISSRSGTKSKMIGLSDQFQHLKWSLTATSKQCFFAALVGTAGVGKTALAEAVFEDPEIISHFEHRIWVTVGRKSQFDDVSRDILAQMYGITQGDHELGAYLKERSEGMKCLIVLDDVWEEQILDSLKRCFRNIDNGSFHILVTTRDRNVILAMINPFSIMLVRFLKEDEGKELLCEKVFGEKSCPFQLDKAANKIVKNCEGLPLMIVTVASILSKAHNIDPKYWEDVAELRNSVFTDAYNEISKVLVWV
ncbi:disease resistance protein RPP13-like [Salvia miltiorrhiza]|uniref:disease resistance protein RPP13-like n=1 Tax=Salvia miltiorrhiza TaxID=226208 RepID=UPI0025AC15A2|nr:disease resistance protein RPP13-like [Salvia miltiorrhiza]